MGGGGGQQVLHRDLAVAGFLGLMGPLQLLICRRVAAQKLSGIHLLVAVRRGFSSLV